MKAFHNKCPNKCRNSILYTQFYTYKFVSQIFISGIVSMLPQLISRVNICDS